MEPIKPQTLECEICNSLFKDPRLLNCGHSYCFQCISKTEENIKCYLCNQITKKEDPLPLNSSLTLIIESMLKQNLLENEPPPQKCPCGELGYKYCEKCEIVFCQVHINEHTNSLFFKNHKIIDLLERKPKKQEDICPKHQKSLEMFCNDCILVICTSCVLDHKNHNLVPIEEESERKRKILTNNFVESLELQFKSNSNLIKELEMKNQILQKELKENENQIFLLKKIMNENSIKEQMDTLHRVMSHISQLYILDPIKSKKVISLINDQFNLFVDDSRVVKNLNFIRQFGMYGTGDGQFNQLYGVTTDQRDNIIVPDFYNNQIQIFDSNGKFIRKFGSPGQGDGQFQFPFGITFNNCNGNIYITDSNNHRIQVFDSNGQFLRKFGVAGFGDGQFQFPRGIRVQQNGNIIISDSNNHRIQILDSTGKYLRKFGSQGSKDGQLYYPYDIACNANGNIFVADYSNHRIQVFDSNGQFLRKFGSQGNTDGKLYYPYGIEVDSENNIIVTDSENHRIQIFSLNGIFIQKIGGLGGGESQFSSPRGLAINSKGNVIVADCFNHRIQVLGK